MASRGLRVGLGSGSSLLKHKRSMALLPSRPSFYALLMPKPQGLLARHFSAVSCFASPTSVPLPSVTNLPEGVLKPLPRSVENLADDPTLHNPLERSQRFGCGWIGVILEYEGVVVGDTSHLHRQAWLKLAELEGKPQPMHWALQKAEGMKNEQILQEVFLWSRNPMEVRRLSAAKEDIYREMLGENTPLIPKGVLFLLEALEKHSIPVALATSAPEVRVATALEVTGLREYFAAVVTAEDVSRGRPDPEAYVYAAQKLGRPPVRCVVIGNSNQSVEAARECGMQCVVVAGRKPIYELAASDLVVRELSELTVMNLKQLFREEDLASPQGELEMELEPELPETLKQVQVLTMTRD